MSELSDIREDMRQLRKDFRSLFLRPGYREDDLVTAGYIAARTSLEERTVLEGKAGTDVIPRVKLGKGKTAPVRFPRGHADRFVAELNRRAAADTTADRVLEFEAGRSKRRRRA